MPRRVFTAKECDRHAARITRPAQTGKLEVAVEAGDARGAATFEHWQSAGFELAVERALPKFVVARPARGRRNFQVARAQNDRAAVGQRGRVRPSGRRVARQLLSRTRIGPRLEPRGIIDETVGAKHRVDAHAPLSVA